MRVKELVSKSSPHSFLRTKTANAMSQEVDKKALEDRIIQVLKTVYDPEIPVDIFELGLIYEVEVKDDASVYVQMTLTSPSCPVAESLPAEVEEKVKQTEGVQDCELDLVFDPPWSKEMISEEAQLELGLL
jgi:FeS assembly SUF system protein